MSNNTKNNVWADFLNAHTSSQEQVNNPACNYPKKIMNHKEYMQMALDQAHKAFHADEVPVGAVLVNESGDVLSSAHNMTISANDPTAHAEILAIRSASQIIKNYRLLNTSLYVTIEPCFMCMGAIIHARVSRVFFGAPDPKWGAAGSLYNFPADLRLNHQPVISSRICEDESKILIQSFFRAKRKLSARKKQAEYQIK